MAMQQTARLNEPVNDRDHVRGPRAAKVSLVEYGDFECPYTRAAQPTLTRLMETLGDNLNVTFRNFPLRQIHPHAQHAAEVAEAAAAQSKFWEMHDKLFANQHALDDASLLKYAEELSLDSDRMAVELARHEHSPHIEVDIESGLKSGVGGTPTFYIDGVRYDGLVALSDMLSAMRERHPDFDVP